MTKTSRHPGNFQRICDLIYVLIGIGSVLAFVLSWTDRDRLMIGFPVLFFLGAALNSLTAFLRFRPNAQHKNQMLQGIFFAFVSVILVMLGVISAVCIWPVL